MEAGFRQSLWAMRHVESEEELVSQTSKTIALFGMVYFFFSRLKIREGVTVNRKLVFQYPQSWLSAMPFALYERNPFKNYFLDHAGSINALDVPLENDGHRQFMEISHAHDLRSGLASGVSRSRLGENFAVLLACSPEADRTTRRHISHALHHMAVFVNEVHDALQRIETLQRARQLSSHGVFEGLGAKKIVCFLHAAQGMDAKNIGLVCGLSPGTVEQYLSAVRKALGARNTAHAVYLSCQAGLI